MSLGWRVVLSLPMPNPTFLLPLLLALASASSAALLFALASAPASAIFAFASTRLHRLTRSFPFPVAQLADADLTVDFSRETQAGDVVTVISTEPLTSNEQWQPLQPGEALLLQQGRVLHRLLPV